MPGIRLHTSACVRIRPHTHKHARIFGVEVLALMRVAVAQCSIYIYTYIHIIYIVVETFFESAYERARKIGVEVLQVSSIN